MDCAQEHARRTRSATAGSSHFNSLDDFKRRVPLSKEELRTLAELGALNCFADHRRAAMWKVEEAMHDDLLGSADSVSARLACCFRRPVETPASPTSRPEGVAARADDLTGARASGLRDDESHRPGRIR